MTPTIFFILLGMFVLGLALIALGRRGRRINNHPICRQCGFDLDGVYAVAPTCPECGAGIKLQRFVRMGARRKLISLIALGTLLAVAPVAPLALYFFAAATGANLNKHKPLGLLLWEARHAAGPRLASIADELEDRVVTGALSADQLTSVVETALAIQADRSRPWLETWGSMVDWVKMNGHLSDQHDRTFCRQAPVFALELRPRVRAGDPLPVIVKLKETRVAPSTNLMMLIDIRSLTVDGEKIATARAPQPEGGIQSLILPWGGQTMQDTQMLYLMGSKGRMGWSSGDQSVAWAFTLPAATAAGSHNVAIEARCYATGMPTGGFTWPDMNKVDEKHLLIVPLSGSIEALPQSTRSVELVPPTDELTKKLADALRPQQVFVQEYAMGAVTQRMIDIQFSIADLPVPACFNVVARQGDKTWPLGVLSSGHGLTNEMGLGWGQQPDVRMLNASIGKLRGKTIDIVLTPNESAALRTTDLTRIYNGELVLRNVEVQEQTGWGAVSTTSTTTDGDKDKSKEGEDAPDKKDP